uniref:Ycf92 n=1 Tax=Osmundaria fimbriata TaxID=228265 RepID=A0A1Z1M4U1_OSMFI|nr:hypothetical protein [Osmundaria fimbriata]ARW60815.1 hypothetical protein [Osmundaria fimbriata]
MNPLQNICSYYYINSPVVLMHKINIQIKLIITFFTIIVVPYFNYFILDTITLLILTVVLFLSLKNYEYILIYLAYIYYVYYTTDYNKIPSTLKLSKIYLPHYINILFITKQNPIHLSLKISLNYYIYYLPYYVKKIMLLNISQFIILNILYKFTRQELILSILTKKIFRLSKFKYFQSIKYNMMVYISFQMLDKTIADITKLKFSIQIKYANWKQINYIYSYPILIQIFCRYLINVVESLNYNSLIIWNRNLKETCFDELWIDLQYKYIE